MTLLGRLLSVLILAITAIWTTAVDAQERLWVNVDSLYRRTCPSKGCGTVGKQFFRESVPVYERRDGWVRTTKLYDASCVAGRSEFVDKGPAECVPANGIYDGKFVEWVMEEYLVAVQPADPSEGAAGTAKLVGRPDDYRMTGTHSCGRLSSLCSLANAQLMTLRLAAGGSSRLITRTTQSISPVAKSTVAYITMLRQEPFGIGFSFGAAVRDVRDDRYVYVLVPC